MQKWEYLWIYIAADPEDKTKIFYMANGKRLDAPSHGAVLNEVGEDGWELVTVALTPPAAFPQFYLKRPISN